MIALLLSHSPADCWVPPYFVRFLTLIGGGREEAQSPTLRCKGAVFRSYRLGAMLYFKAHCGSIRAALFASEFNRP